jgi:O-antigen ligase
MVALAMTAFSGQMRQVPPFSWLALDFTVTITLLAVALAGVHAIVTWSSGRAGPRMALLALLAIGLIGTVVRVPTLYADDKILRFFLVTGPALMVTVLVVKDHRDTYRLARLLAVVGFFLTTSIAFGGKREFDQELGRLTSQTGDTITFGLAAATVIVWILAVFPTQRISPQRVLILGGLCAFQLWTLLSIASRGPIQGVILAAVAMIGLQVSRFKTRDIVRTGAVLIAVIIGLISIWSRVPLWARERVAGTATDGSGSARIQAWSYTWSNVDGSPAGRGWGSWDLYSPIHIGHPHNIVLEVWYEAGFIALVILIALLLLVYRHQLAVFAVDRSAATLIVGLLTLLLASAQVSNDFKENKLLFVMVVAAAAPVARDLAGGRGEPELVTSNQAATTHEPPAQE